MRKVSEKKF